MTRQEALDAMKKGLKITHRYFSPNEWMKSRGTYFVFEDGVEIEKSAFWSNRNTIEWHDGFEIIKAWGFEYSTAIVWAKNRMGGGLGGTFRITTEYLLFAKKGKLKSLKTIGSTWHNVKRTYENGKPKHSKKPDFFYELIEQTSPGLKLEMFARSKREGWDIWGNELQNDIEITT